MLADPDRRNPATIVTHALQYPEPIYPRPPISNSHPGNGHSRENGAMTSHTTGTREEWLAARLDLLEAEKS